MLKDLDMELGLQAQPCLQARDKTVNGPQQARKSSPLNKSLILLIKLERANGFEPSTLTLARLCSTPELRPHSKFEGGGYGR